MVYAITGGPGFGKTTVLNQLGKLHFPVCQENARQLLQSDVKPSDSGRTHHLPMDFEKMVAMHRLKFLQETALDTIAFSDRGLPDQIAYSCYKNMIPSAFIQELVRANRYAPFVFVTPPWEEIFLQDEIRKENFEDALEIHDQILNAYLKCNYKIINLPLANPEERVRFILNFLGI
jgi:predicted ATPase